LAIDASGNIWVSDDQYYRIEQFSSTGSFIRSVHGSGYGGTGPAEFSQPGGIAIDSSGNLWVVDRGNDRVQKLSSTGQYISSFGTQGVDDGEFDTPTVIGIRPSGNMLVPDRWTGRVQQFTPSHQYMSQFGAGQLVEPEGIALGPGGSIYVANSHANRVEIWRAATPTVTTGSATGITARQAVLTGSVNPRGLPTTYHFEHRVGRASQSISLPEAGAGDGTNLSKSPLEQRCPRQRNRNTGWWRRTWRERHLAPIKL
jgi:DNA-binding beta-propeller fold protein YncE